MVHVTHRLRHIKRDTGTVQTSVVPRPESEWSSNGSEWRPAVGIAKNTLARRHIRCQIRTDHWGCYLESDTPSVQTMYRRLGIFTDVEARF